MSIKHGDRRQGHTCSLYIKWCDMKARCYRKTVERYATYGGKGIQVCDAWKNSYPIFKAWALDSGYVQGLTIHREDNDKNYEPSNCVWLTKKEHDALNTPPPPPVIRVNDAQIREIHQLHIQGVSGKDISNILSVAQPTVYGILRGKVCPRYAHFYNEIYGKEAV